ncbi:FAD-binding oxidoreductase [Komagataeibacter xylinus]|uniref:FAD-binding oxidoreductase n=1 Tax=Komagataeibacter xylinus TaxID=28448 RepID=A0A857FQ26_KOMXY|nr:FAD-dependent oxidoreductase [Komagataeibacter xylinus]QHC35609.1 FAD-binding oxidoreductase [Komagataeibacter xylinus]
MMYDTIVIGAGIIGASVGYHVARAGGRVAIIDPGMGPVQPTASWASAGGLRAQGRSPAEAAIAHAAQQRWQVLEDELEADMEVRFGGHLHIAENAVQAERIRKRVSEAQDAGIEARLLAEAEIHDIAPGLARAARLACFTPQDGQASPILAARAFLAAAVRLGATLVPQKCASIPVEQGRVSRIVLGDGTSLSARTVVVCTGAWSISMLDALGLRFPLRWRVLQMMTTEAQPGVTLAPTVTGEGRNLSLKQMPDGNYMIGGRWFGNSPDGLLSACPDERHLACQLQTAREVFPAMRHAPVQRTWAGCEAQTIDSLPLIGHSALAGLYLSVGFSNHGFQIAPEIGRLVAQDITDASPDALHPFAPDRFERQVSASRVEAFITETTRLALH